MCQFLTPRPSFLPHRVVFFCSQYAKFARQLSKQMESAVLNQREKDILRLIAAGNTTRQIAEAISLSPDTVKWYRKRLIAKIGAANSVEMVRKALEMNIL